MLCGLVWAERNAALRITHCSVAVFPVLFLLPCGRSPGGDASPTPSTADLVATQPSGTSFPEDRAVTAQSPRCRTPHVEPRCRGISVKHSWLPQTSLIALRLVRDRSWVRTAEQK